jgi:hypothetical protein
MTTSVSSAPGTPGIGKWFGILIILIILILILLWLLGVFTPGGTQGMTVFVSSETYDGNFGNGQITLGHLAADAVCQQLAAGTGLGGEYKAWISGRVDGGPGPFHHGVVDRFAQSTIPYRLVDGTKVADDWADLTDGTLDHAINLTESGGALGNETRVWTNTRSNGAAWDNSRNCAPGTGPDVPGVASWSCGAPTWTAGDCQFESGKYGIATATDGSWTGTASSNTACTNAYHLYCVQQ